MKTLSGKQIDDELVEPTPYQLAILGGLQNMRLYQGTVPRHVTAAMRRRNKAARIARRANR